MSVEEQRQNNVGGITGKGFLPGQSGNPNGRPKGRTLTALLRERLETVADESTGETYGEQLAKAWVDAALDGNVAAIKEALDRTEGKVPDKIKASVGRVTSSDQVVAVMLRVLQVHPDARIAVAKELRVLSYDSARTGDGSGPGDPDGSAGPEPGPLAG